MGRFILLTYNLSALYAYSLSVKDDDDDDDEGGISPEIWEIVLHRVVAVMAGCIWGIIVTRLIWPISARRKVKKGTSLLWLKMGLIWKRGPLKTLLEANLNEQRHLGSYLGEKEELELRRFLTHLETLCASATSEFELRGPFPGKSFKIILDATSRILDSFHALNVIVLKEFNASEGEKEVLKYTKKEWTELSWRISHLFSGKSTAPTFTIYQLTFASHGILYETSISTQRRPTEHRPHKGSIISEGFRVQANRARQGHCQGRGLRAVVRIW
jgi:hypothetical protein